MAIEHVNRRGDMYYLHERKTKKGNPAYSFSKKEDGALVESIPDGYEIYEDPDARVYLRKIQPKIFTDKEISTVENGVRKYAKVDKFIIDVKKNNIVVFLPNQDLDEYSAMLSKLAPFASKAKFRESWEESVHYSRMMRFVLVDKENREFVVERWCFLGSIDDWIFIDSSNDLAGLVKKYCKHLGGDSFYELSEFNPEGKFL